MMTTASPTEGPSIRFAVLGPVRAWRGRTEVTLGSRQQQCVLALLLTQTGQPVATEDLVEVLWGACPPAQAVNIVHQHIGGLRRLLEPDLPPRSAGRYIQRRRGGYLLEASSDLIHFRRLAERAQRGSDLSAFVEALGLWEGPCAAGLDPGPERHAAFQAVDHERSVVARQAADVALAPGAARRDVRAVIGVLSAAAEQDPYDEPLQSRLILALDADGQSVEARSIYDRIRAWLADELGMDPGPELQRAYDATVRRDRSAEPGRVLQVPAQLPATSRLFTGRRAELRTLTDLLPRDDSPGTGVMTVAIDGIPGVGKSTLAIHWAHLVAARFPDGQLFVNMRGYDPGGAVVAPQEALTGFLSAMGVDQRTIPAGVEAQAALYRTMTTGRRLLIVVDNARDAEQVRPLIPGAEGSMVVVTSRNRMTGLAALDGAHLLSLDVPSLKDARDDLRRRLGDQRASTEPAALDDIIRSCGRLPLAMAIVGARVAAHPADQLQAVALQLRSHALDLDAFGGDEPERDFRTVFSGSYHILSEPAAKLFRTLSLHPGPDIGLATVAALVGTEPRKAIRLIGELTRTRLLTEHRYRRYVFHDLIRMYALELATDLDREADRLQARRDILYHLRLSAHAANAMVTPSMLPRALCQVHDTPVESFTDASTAMLWFAAEAPVIEMFLSQAIAADGVRPWELAITLLAYYQRAGLYRTWSTTATFALNHAVVAGDVTGEAHMLRMLAGAEHFQGDSDQALLHLDRALTLFRELGLLDEQGFVLHNMGWVQYAAGRPELAVEHYESALKIFTDLGNSRGEAFSLLGLGYNLNRRGQYDDALQVLTRSAQLFEQLGDENAVASCLDALANVHRAQGDYERAIRLYRQALQVTEGIGNIVNQVEGRTGLGETLRVAGRPTEAAAELQRAIALADRYGLLVEAAEGRKQLSLVGKHPGLSNDGGT